MADKSSREGKAYFDPDMLAWVARVHAPHDAALARAFDAPAAADMPAIQVGPSEGKLLGLLLGLAGAKKVVELGTLAGYSALHMARALPEDGHLWTVEVDERHASIARDVLAAAGVASKVDVVLGRGADVLPTLERHGPFCAVFVDADKESYDVYGRWAAKHLRRGGLLIGDNAFLFGHLLGGDPRSAVMQRFHRETAEAFDSVCVPTPDGLVIGVKR